MRFMTYVHINQSNPAAACCFLREIRTFNLSVSLHPPPPLPSIYLSSTEMYDATFTLPNAPYGSPLRTWDDIVGRQTGWGVKSDRHDTSLYECHRESFVCEWMEDIIKS